MKQVNYSCFFYIVTTYYFGFFVGDGDLGLDQDLDAYTYDDADREHNNVNEESGLGGNNSGPSSYWVGSSSTAVPPVNEYEDIN